MLALAYFLTSQLAYTSMGCGALRFEQQLDVTGRLVEHWAPFNPSVGELATRNGSYECARFSFLIDKFGQAKDIRVEESSRDISMILDARLALEKYRFRHPVGAQSQRYMLIFDGMVNRWPQPPPDR